MSPAPPHPTVQADWSWSGLDKLLTAVVLAVALCVGAWQARYELFVPNAARTSRQPAAPPPAADYARLIDDENFHVQLGVAYASSGMLDQAVFEQQQALRINPASLPALTSLGYVLYLKGHFQESASALERALSVDPHSDLARSNLLMTCARAIETATSDDERRRWQNRRLAAAVPSPAGAVTPEPDRSK